MAESETIRNQERQGKRTHSTRFVHLAPHPRSLGVWVVVLRFSRFLLEDDFTFPFYVFIESLSLALVKVFFVLLYFFLKDSLS